MTRVATLHVRNVPDDVYERLRTRARLFGRSINAEAIEVLREALHVPRPQRRSIVDDLKRLRVALPPGMPTPEQMIKDMRDGRRPA